MSKLEDDTLSKGWRRSLLSVHPIVVSVFFIVCFFAGGVANFARLEVTPTLSIGMALALLLPLAQLTWARALHAVASSALSRKLGRKIKAPRFVFQLALGGFAALFLTSIARPILGSAASDVAGLVETVALGVGVLFYFAANWAAAHALVKFEEGKDKVHWHMSVGTFLLVVYLLIGIWFLRGRIMKLLAVVD